jgi:hypothetical protein
MTEHKSFKRLVRTRMEKTGESYTSARAALLRADEADPAAPEVAEIRLPAPDEAIRARTGRGWEEWFDALDEWGGAQSTHRDMARWVAEQQGIVPLAWNAQAVVAGYERARGLREIGEHPNGYAVTASKTVGVPVDRLYAAWVDDELRRRWLPDAELRARTATAPRSARFDWGDGTRRVHVTFAPKGDGRSVVALRHERLADGVERDRMKTYWRDRVATLKEVLEA